MKKERKIEELNPNQLRIEFTSNESIVKTKGDYLKIKIPTATEGQTINVRFDLDKSNSEIVTLDEQIFKTIDKKEFMIKIKKKKLIFWREDVDEKKFRPTELGSKCEVVKEIRMVNSSVCSLKL